MQLVLVCIILILTVSLSKECGPNINMKGNKKCLKEKRREFRMIDQNKDGYINEDEWT